ncbi:hypothetical protein EHQ12_08455 [Leptospira gomenensis]|uniref:Outer membrane lipoprotein-sorting protein n=1 Tax=Leptospira gomenensis TaxID=2484974 RepID=A0A5F1YCW3_9LEPT|nr:hypothetical protein [Leptospira gomenensis]TGK35914.1 hypothetical protein EHQ17_04835 [Leptospira gomenensis]TGK40054.1 hypothetical protein EHQ12_08455 [Leptospira gomenensis]TGK51504.1 hypothetical protein EHQ07_02850 [Leptospira gomenensis]TGK68061.1 hypothetical protein EHQ13_01380 [Leptospira gomenensis]
MKWKFLFLILYILEGTFFSEREISAKEDLNQIFETIKQNSRNSISKFKGIDYRRDLIVTETNSETGQKISVSQISTRRVEYYYERPVIVALSYVKNGQALSPKEYEPERASPTYPIFDDQSQDHYSYRISGPVTIRDKFCYEIEVSPLQSSPRHFKGKIYYEKNSLKPYYLEGTVAKRGFGVKNLYFRMFLELTKENVPYVKSGEIFIKSYVPLLSPEKETKIELQTLDAVPIRK